MKRLLLFISIFVFTFFFTSVISAQEASNPDDSGITREEADGLLPYPIPQNPPFLGQNHWYTVTYRGNGEAVVALKVALTNSSEKDNLKEVELRFPNVKPEDLVVYQIIAQGQCILYENRTLIGHEIPKCLAYNDPDYYGYSYNNKYQKATFDYTGDTLKVTLPVSIVPQKSGAFFVYFRAFGFADKNVFGAYKFNFETLKVNDSINQISVGINTDADQYLKGAKGEIDYRQAEVATAMKGAPSADAASANSALDRFVGQIGYGEITKTASNLSPSESYQVDGMFADSRIKLYGKEVIIFLGFVILVFLITIIVAKVLIKNLKNSTVTEASSHAQKKEAKELKVYGNPLVLSIGLSFIDGFVITGYTVLLIFLLGSLNYGYTNYQTAQLIRLAAGVFSAFFYTVTLLAPAVYLGYRTTVGWALVYLFMTIGWLFLFFLTGIILFAIFGYPNEGFYPPVMPLFGGRDAVQAVDKAVAPLEQLPPEALR